jgi:hypothetical protein
MEYKAAKNSKYPVLYLVEYDVVYFIQKKVTIVTGKMRNTLEPPRLVIFKENSTTCRNTVHDLQKRIHAGCRLQCTYATPSAWRSGQAS